MKMQATSSLLYTKSDFVCEWVADRLGEDFGECKGIGIVRGDKFVGGVVYNRFHGHDIQMSIATIDSRWCNRAVLHGLFTYAFVDCGVKRISAMTARKNKPARELLIRLGFKLEGTLRLAFDGRQDAMVYGMLKKECKWIKDN